MSVRPFTDTLIAIRFGELAEETSDALNELVQACASTGKAGSLTLTIKLKPGKAGQMELIDDVKLKLPAPERGSTLMFATPEGNLQREDPRQLSIEGLREVKKPAETMKEVANG